MRPLLPFVLILFLILSCNNSKKTTPRSKEDVNFIGLSYYDYREIPSLKNYKKVSDTSFIAKGFPGNFETTHRITELKERERTLILFNKVTFDDNYHEINSILDTLRINNLNKNSYITIGYCESENILMEQTIAIAEKTNNDTIQKIILAWKGDTKVEKFVKIENPEILLCLNEF